MPDYDFVASLFAWLRTLPGVFTDPGSPFWWPSLLAAGVAGVVMAVIAGLRLRDVPGYLCPEDRRALWRGLPVDLACFLAGSTLPFVLGPLLFLLSFGGMGIGAMLLAPITGLPQPDAPAPGWGFLLLAAIAAFTFGDFALYWSHRLFHRVPMLWRAHRLHHAPRVLTPLTAFRFWPHEHLTHLSGNMLAQGVALGMVAALAGTRVQPMDLLGVNIVSMIWGLAFAHLRHSHVPMPFPRWFSFVFVSPHMHQVHHSEEMRHHDRNFGTALAVWDWMFGTIYVPDRKERFRFGLGEDAPASATAAPPAPPR